jgi:aspartyl-tRNA(Asn)/glutamyl-tRNA(Gln) amidotransferase subunit A
VECPSPTICWGPAGLPVPRQELCYLPISEAARAIAAREISPVDLVQATLQRIERLNDTVGSYLTVMGEVALAAAREAEREIGRGEHRGPLHGIPVSLKDIIYVKGVRNTAGSKVLADFVPAYDATVTEKLRAAGAVIIGKAQMYELAMGPKTTYHYGRTRNPWALERATTGSSSGSAAGVAAGLAHASLGTDTGGSVRGPASMCGVVGHKPTYGLVSRYGVTPLSWSMDSIGPITRTVADCALVMSAISGYDPPDPASLDATVPDFTGFLSGEIQGLKVGLASDFFSKGMAPDFEAAFQEALRVLESAGASLREVSFPSMAHAQGAHSVILLAEGASVHEETIRTGAALLGDNARTRLETGSFLLATDYLKAQRIRAIFQRDFADAMREVDVLVTPTSPGPPQKFDEAVASSDARGSATAAANRFRRPFNLVGAPAISVPCGFDSTGVPVGLQVVARPMEDGLVLKVAHAYEQRTEWHKRRPPLT